jgi:hypothetical protein
MKLQAIFTLCHKKSYFSREDEEVWAAINLVSQRIFQKILAENRGFFIVFDTTSLTLQLNVEEYALPATCSQLLRVRERLNSASPWRIINPADLNDPGFVDAQFASVLGPDQDGPVSEFEYYGPYLSMQDAQTDAQIERFRIEPPPQDPRQVELVFVARYVEINSAADPKTLPNEADGAVVAFAAASLLGDNDDSARANLLDEGERNEREFLKWVRNRQFQKVRTVEPYVEDLD